MVKLQWPIAIKENQEKKGKKIFKVFESIFQIFQGQHYIEAFTH